MLVLNLLTMNDEPALQVRFRLVSQQIEILLTVKFKDAGTGGGGGEDGQQRSPKDFKQIFL